MDQTSETLLPFHKPWTTSPTPDGNTEINEDEECPESPLMPTAMLVWLSQDIPYEYLLRMLIGARYSVPTYHMGVLLAISRTCLRPITGQLMMMMVILFVPPHAQKVDHR